MVPRYINLRLRGYSAGADDQPEAPAILLTSREARNEGKRYYTLCRELKDSRRAQPWKYSRRDNKLDPRLRSAARSCTRNRVWIKFAVDRFIHEPCVQYYWNIGAVRPMKVECGFCFEDVITEKIRHVALRFDSAESQGQTIFNCDKAVAFLKNMLVKDSVGKITLIKYHQIGKDGNIR